MSENKSTKPRKFPPKWTDVYPQGTKEGDEEQRFFIVLERNPKWTLITTEALAKEAKLTPERVERICNKYLKKGMIFQSLTEDGQSVRWGYWERNMDLLDPPPKSICETDQKNRINGLK